MPSTTHTIKVWNPELFNTYNFQIFYWRINKTAAHSCSECQQSSYKKACLGAIVPLSVTKRSRLCSSMLETNVNISSQTDGSEIYSKLWMVYHLQSWLHGVSIYRQHPHCNLLLWGAISYKNCYPCTSYAELEKSPSGFFSTTIFIFVCAISSIHFTSVLRSVSLSFLLGGAWMGALRASTANVTAGSSKKPAITQQSLSCCQHASTSPISIEGDFPHAVWIKQRHAAEAAKCSWGAF